MPEVSPQTEMSLDERLSLVIELDEPGAWCNSPDRIATTGKSASRTESEKVSRGEPRRTLTSPTRWNDGSQLIADRK